MKKLIISLTLAVVAALATPGVVAQNQWREYNQEVNSPTLVDPKITEGVELFCKDGNIVIRSTHRVQVKVFTILGQQVSVATVGPGTSALKLNARGIFIVKIGNFTQKVAM